MKLYILVDRLEELTRLYERKIIKGKKTGTPMEKQILNQIRLTIDDLLSRSEKISNLEK